MTNETSIAVIIPVYNSENTIEYTVKCLQNQTMTEFELILVDDGSTDRSYEICQKLAMSDNRIQVIHQENKGQSVARNTGIMNTNAQYICFVDSDDIVEIDMLEQLELARNTYQADCVIANLDRVKMDYRQVASSPKRHMEELTQEDALKEMLLSRKTTVTPCGKLIPRKWYQESPFRPGKFYEDLAQTYQLLLKADKIACVDAVLYHYVMRPGSITGKKILSKKQCMDYWEAIGNCHEDVCKVLPQLVNETDVLMAKDYMSLYLSINRCQQRDDELIHMQEHIVPWMRSHAKSVIKYVGLSNSFRMRVMLFACSPRLYELMYYWGIRLKGKGLD